MPSKPIVKWPKQHEKKKQAKKAPCPMQLSEQLNHRYQKYNFDSIALTFFAITSIGFDVVKHNRQEV